MTQLLFTPGHNWGSEHDPTGGSDVQCNPSLNDGGKYLMFSSATDGEQRNNNRFSPCSRRDISDVLRAKSSTCFIGKWVKIDIVYWCVAGKGLHNQLRFFHSVSI